MPNRINKAIELLEQDQVIFYTGGHTGADLTYEGGVEAAKTYADYINIGMEHGSFDMAGLDNYMRGLVDGGPTTSGHRTPAVIVEVPPTRSNSCSCNSLSSFGCVSSGMSPISSRKSVPLWANSKRPRFCETAPVKAPFS